MKLVREKLTILAYYIFINNNNHVNLNLHREVKHLKIWEMQMQSTKYSWLMDKNGYECNGQKGMNASYRLL
jgi:hypothetical protein